MAGKKLKWTLAIVLIVLVLAALWAAAFALAGGGGATLGGEWEEELLEEGESGDKIVVISVFGEIFSDPQGGVPGASDENIASQLEQAANDEAVLGVILHLETPGGGVVPSDVIYGKILQLKEDVEIPVVAYMGDVAASGGYYIAAAADEIIANPATITGSLGVIWFIPNLEGTAAKLGIKPLVIKSKPLKDIASPFREMTPEERSIIQSLVDEAYARFVDIIATGRKLDRNRVIELADGRIYSGKQAKDLGLVDHLGDQTTAFERAKELAEAPDASLVRYFRSPGFEDLLGLGFSAAKKPSTEDLIPTELRPGLKYLWIQ